MSAADTTAASERPVRLYGGWRLRRGIGLWGLDAPTTALVLACLMVPLLLTAASPRLGAISALPAAAVAGVSVLRVGGLALTAHATRRVRWQRATRSGRRSRRYGPNAAAATAGGGRATQHSARWPAPLGGLDLRAATSTRGGDFAVVHDVEHGTLTAAVRCAASSAWLVDRDDADGWVAAWHAWLASLGYLPAVCWVAVIVETAPEPGTALRDAIAARIDPTAPADARAMLRELVARAPAATAHVATWVALTFDANRLGGASAGAMASADGRAGAGARTRGSSGRLTAPSGLTRLAAGTAEVDRLMAGLETSLASCGVTVLGRASLEELSAVVADAYDPASRGRRPTPPTRRDLRRAASSRGWDLAAPVAIEEGWDHLLHDSGCSASWGWQEAPRQHVTSDVLSRLHSPGRHPKRVALLYRPMPAAEAARVLESEVNAANFRDALRRAQHRDETARDVADREQARRAAREEAMGAGVVLVSVYITTTVTDPAVLADAVADVEARADQAKMRLRRLYGGQAVGFAATLPLGIHPVAWTTRTRQTRRTRSRDHDHSAEQAGDGTGGRASNRSRGRGAGPGSRS